MVRLISTGRLDTTRRALKLFVKNTTEYLSQILSFIVKRTSYHITHIFKSSNIDLVKECQSYFRCVMPSLTVKDRS